MHGPWRTYDAVFATVALGLGLYLVFRLLVVFAKGEIDRRPPQTPYTRERHPWEFWGITITATLGAVILFAGAAIRFYRLLAL